MKKNMSTNKLLACKKRKSTGKLGQFEQESVVRKAHASLGIMSRAASKRKLDVFRIALERQHNEVDDTKNATFGPLDLPGNMSSNDGEKNDTGLHRFLRPSNLSSALPQPHGQAQALTGGMDLPPSLPRRFGSVENTGLPLPTLVRQQCHNHNARFDASISNLEGEIRNAELPMRSPSNHNPFWDSGSRIDMPPSYHRPESVSTQLNRMCLAGSTKKKLGMKSPTLPLPFQHVVEIRPGVMAKVRGAQETWSCLKRDFYQASACQACKIELTSIRDLDYVLCPTCGQLTDLKGGGGVGLGFTFTDLRRWELEHHRSLDAVEEIKGTHFR